MPLPAEYAQRESVSRTQVTVWVLVVLFARERIVGFRGGGDVDDHELLSVARVVVLDVIGRGLG